MRLSRVIYRESFGVRMVADATVERPLALEDGVVWIGGGDGGARGIPLGRCLELVAEVPEPLPTAPDFLLRRPIVPRGGERRSLLPWRRSRVATDVAAEPQPEGEPCPS